MIPFQTRIPDKEICHASVLLAGIQNSLNCHNVVYKFVVALDAS